MSDYLITDLKEQALAYVAALNKMCGYPNPATKTLTAVNIEETKDGKFLVMLPDGIYAPKLNKYIESRTALPKDRQKEITITDSKNIIIKDQSLADKEQTISKFAIVSYSIKVEMIDNVNVTADNIKNEEPILDGKIKP